MCGGSAYRTFQSKAQSAVRPASWIPGLRCFHNHRESWKSMDNIGNVFRELLESIKTLSMNSDEKIEIGMVDEQGRFIRIFFYTDVCQWLDIVELSFISSDQDNGTIVQAFSFSSGLLPIWIPLSFVFNMVFFLFPFYDWGQNKEHLRVIRGSSECPLVLDAEAQ